MSNLELASICIAIFSICCALSGVILVILHRQERKVNDQTLKRIVKTVFKTPETGIVTITARFNSMK